MNKENRQCKIIFSCCPTEYNKEDLLTYSIDLKEEDSHAEIIKKAAMSLESIAAATMVSREVISKANVITLRIK